MACFQLVGRDPTATAELDVDVARKRFRLTVTRRGRTVVHEGRLRPHRADTEWLLCAPRRLGAVRLARYFEVDAVCVDRLHGVGRTWTPDRWHPPVAG